MNKTTKLDIIWISGLIIISLIGVYSINNNYSNEFDASLASCNNGRIGGQTDPQGIPEQGYRFDIVIPSGECKNDVILSKANYTKMQNNVGYFTVKNKTPVTAVPTHNWCPLEQWIWDGHQGYYNVTKYQKWMLTEYCAIERNPPKVIHLTDTLEINDIETHDIPEFGPIGLMILTVAIISIITVSAKSKVIPRF